MNGYMWPHQNMLRTLKDRLMKREMAIEELTPAILLEYGIDYVANSRNRCRERNCRVSNHCATGTTRIHTLRHSLSVTERKWACPECKLQKRRFLIVIITIIKTPIKHCVQYNDFLM